MKKTVNSILGLFNLRLIKSTYYNNISNDPGYISAKETVKSAQMEGL